MFIDIANITIPALWVAVLAALFITSTIYRLFSGEKVGDWYWNGFFLYLLIWKLSYALFHFDMVMDLPLSILYFNGGIKGHMIGLILFIMYLFIIRKKQPSLNKKSIHTMLLFFLTYEVIINLLNNNWLEFIGHLIVCITYSTILFYLLKKNKNITGLLVALLILLELLFLSIFSTIFSMEAFTLIIIGLTVLFVSKGEQGGRNI